MTKQLIALALAAAFGIAHAADAKPAPDSKAAPSVKLAADTTNKGPDAATGKSPEMKTDTMMNNGAATKHHKKVRKSHQKKAGQGDANKAEPATPATPAEPAKK